MKGDYIFEPPVFLVGDDSQEVVITITFDNDWSFGAILEQVTEIYKSIESGGASTNLANNLHQLEVVKTISVQEERARIARWLNENDFHQDVVDDIQNGTYERDWR